MLSDEALSAIRDRLYERYPGLEEDPEYGSTGWDAPDILTLLAEIEQLRTALVQ